MQAQFWILALVAVAVALALGFLGGRMSAPRQRRVEAMEQERDTARREAEEVRTEVNRHFEDSARMFGKLAEDYRTFFQQFAQTAQNLGLSEGQARALLQQADPSLVERQADAERDPVVTASNGGDVEAGGEQTPAAHSGQDRRASSDSTAAEAPSETQAGAAGGVQAGEAHAHQEAETTPSPSTASQSACADGTRSASGDTAAGAGADQDTGDAEAPERAASGPSASADQHGADRDDDTQHSG